MNQLEQAGSDRVLIREKRERDGGWRMELEAWRRVLTKDIKTLTIINYSHGYRNKCFLGWIECVCVCVQAVLHSLLTGGNKNSDISEHFVTPREKKVCFLPKVQLSFE